MHLLRCAFEQAAAADDDDERVTAERSLASPDPPASSAQTW